MKKSTLKRTRQLLHWLSGESHMACKSRFVSVVYAWLEDPMVVEAFSDSTIGGKQRLENLRKNLEFSRGWTEANYDRRLSKKLDRHGSKDAAAHGA